jgi:hypothetical protein
VVLLLEALRETLELVMLLLLVLLLLDAERLASGTDVEAVDDVLRREKIGQTLALLLLVRVQVDRLDELCEPH